MITNEKRLAILENKKVTEILIERPATNKLIGNVYKGKVVNVLPGMQAAFVDIGLEKNGFLYRDELVSFQQLEENEIQKKRTFDLSICDCWSRNTCSSDKRRFW
jgi:ribonuclease G